MYPSKKTCTCKHIKMVPVNIAVNAPGEKQNTVNYLGTIIHTIQMPKNFPLTAQLFH